MPGTIIPKPISTRHGTLLFSAVPAGVAAVYCGAAFPDSATPYVLVTKVQGFWDAPSPPSACIAMAAECLSWRSIQDAFDMGTEDAKDIAATIAIALGKTLVT